MIFKDKLEEKGKIIENEFTRLLDLAWERQGHIGDLLLVYANGFYEPNTLIWNKNHPDKKHNPHVVGLGRAGHSEHTHYSFIHKYRTSHIHELNYSDYIKQFEMKEWDEEKSKRNEILIDDEETTIQLEMLIYLKFWEADLIIKEFYQLARILNGENYDWYFKVAESNRDKDCTGTRQNIIRKEIRDKIKIHSPQLFEIFKATYKTQIRNSIAHSNYSFLGRNIHPNNYIEKDPYNNIRALTFDTWVDMFHNTIILHNEYVRMNNVINEHYAKITAEYDNIMEILVTEKNGKQYPLYLEYRPEWKDWTYKQ